MAKPKKPKKIEFFHPAVAVTNALQMVKDLSCITLTQAKKVEGVVSSGSVALDLILGGGYPRGRFATIFGPEGCGKSTYLQELIVSCQRLNITVVHYDFEGGSDPVYMTNQGIDLERSIELPLHDVDSAKKSKQLVDYPNYFYCQPSFGEQAYRHILTTLKHLPDIENKGPPRIVFVDDSFTAMASEETDDETGQARLAPDARMHSHYLHLIRPKLRLKGAFLIGSNQMRAAIGQWGNPQQEAGGSALRYYPDQKVMVTRRKLEKDKTDVDVLPNTLRTIKNKVYVPHKILEGVGIVLGRGIDKALDTRVFLQKLGYLHVRKGKSVIKTPKYETKMLSWEDLRRLSENIKFRRHLFNLLKHDETYELYQDLEKSANFTYDKLYKVHEAEEKLDKVKLRKQINEDAEEYKEERRKRARLRRSKRSKAERIRDERLEEEVESETPEEEEG